LVPYCGRMADSDKTSWRGRRGRVLRTGPMQASRGWAEKALERIEAKEEPEHVLERRQKVLDRQIKVHGIDGGPTANARGDVARQLEKMGRLVEARVLWEEAVAAYRRNRGADDEYTVQYEERLATNLAKSGLSGEARLLVAHVCDVRLRTLGSENEETKRALRQLAAIDADDQ
jgi:hypothetical protein